MKKPYVQRDALPSYPQRMARDRMVAETRPRAGHGLREKLMRDCTVLEVEGDGSHWPHPWRVEAVLDAGGWVLLRVEPGVVTYNDDAEEAVLGVVAEGPPELWRTAAIAMSDWMRPWMLGIEAARFVPARWSRRGLPEPIHSMSGAGRKGARTVLGASVGVMADLQRRRGERFLVQVVPEPPRFELSSLDRGVAEFFGLDQVDPILATWCEVATLWLLAPEDDPAAAVPDGRWSLLVQQRECWNFVFDYLPPVDAETEQLLVDPALRWFLGRYTQAPAATVDASQALTQLATAYAFHKPPVAGFWT